MNRLPSVLALTNIMMLASGLLLGGALIFPKYEKPDMFVAFMWILALAFFGGAVLIQAWAITSQEPSMKNGSTLHKPFPTPPPPPKKR